MSQWRSYVAKFLGTVSNRFANHFKVTGKVKPIMTRLTPVSGSKGDFSQLNTGKKIQIFFLFHCTNSLFLTNFAAKADKLNAGR